MAFHRGQGPFRRQLFLNFKGGVGKTTLSAAYGLLMAEAGHAVLFVDLDPQGHLTRYVGINEWQFDKTLYHVFLRDAPIAEVMKAVPGLPGSYVVPSDISVSAAELSLGGLPYREWRLVHALSPLRRQFDLVVFDAAPTVSLINLNAILASDDLIIPVLAETLSVHSLTSLMKTLASIEADFGHPLGNAAVLLNRFVPSDPRCMEMRNHLRASCEGRCLRTVVRYCADLSHQPMERRLGSRLKLEGEVLADIQSLADEIAPRKEPRRRAEEGDGTL